VTYIGEFNVARIGTFTATVDPHEFRRICELVDHAQFSELPDTYASTWDGPVVNVSVSRGGQLKTIHDGSGSSVPIDLWALEMAIDGLVGQISQCTHIN
jgi:hypothetical protein